MENKTTEKKENVSATICQNKLIDDENFIFDDKDGKFCEVAYEFKRLFNIPGIDVKEVHIFKENIADNKTLLKIEVKRETTEAEKSLGIIMEITHVFPYDYNATDVDDISNMIDEMTNSIKNSIESAELTLSNKKKKESESKALEAMLEGKSGQECYDIAYNFVCKGEYDKALSCLNRSAQLGHTGASIVLEDAYYTGHHWWRRWDYRA